MHMSSEKNLNDKPVVIKNDIFKIIIIIIIIIIYILCEFCRMASILINAILMRCSLIGQTYIHIQMHVIYETYSACLIQIGQVSGNA